MNSKNHELEALSSGEVQGNEFLTEMQKESIRSTNWKKTTKILDKTNQKIFSAQNENEMVWEVSKLISKYPKKSEVSKILDTKNFVFKKYRAPKKTIGENFQIQTIYVDQLWIFDADWESFDHKSVLLSEKDFNEKLFELYEKHKSQSFSLIKNENWLNEFNISDEKFEKISEKWIALLDEIAAFKMFVEEKNIIDLKKLFPYEATHISLTATNLKNLQNNLLGYSKKLNFSWSENTLNNQLYARITNLLAKISNFLTKDSDISWSSPFENWFDDIKISDLEQQHFPWLKDIFKDYNPAEIKPEEKSISFDYKFESAPTQVDFSEISKMFSNYETEKNASKLKLLYSWFEALDKDITVHLEKWYELSKDESTLNSMVSNTQKIYVLPEKWILENMKEFFELKKLVPSSQVDIKNLKNISLIENVSSYPDTKDISIFVLLNAIWKISSNDEDFSVLIEYAKNIDPDNFSNEQKNTLKFLVDILKLKLSNWVDIWQTQQKAILKLDSLLEKNELDFSTVIQNIIADYEQINELWNQINLYASQNYSIEFRTKKTVWNRFFSLENNEKIMQLNKENILQVYEFLRQNRRLISSYEVDNIVMTKFKDKYNLNISKNSWVQKILWLLNPENFDAERMADIWEKNINEAENQANKVENTNPNIVISDESYDLSSPKVVKIDSKPQKVEISKPEKKSFYKNIKRKSLKLANKYVNRESYWIEKVLGWIINFWIEVKNDIELDILDRFYVSDDQKRDRKIDRDIQNSRKKRQLELSNEAFKRHKEKIDSDPVWQAKKSISVSSTILKHWKSQLVHWRKIFFSFNERHKKIYATRDLVTFLRKNNLTYKDIWISEIEKKLILNIE